MHILDPILYNIRHPQNRILIQVQRYITYNLNPRAPKSRPPHVRVSFNFRHQLVRDDIPQPSLSDGVKLHVSLHCFRQPFRRLLSAEGVRPAFEAMISRLEIPFELRSEFGQLAWCSGFDDDDDEGVPIDDVLDTLSKVTERIVLLVNEDLPWEREPIRELEILVDTTKRTVIATELYRSLDHDYDDFHVDSLKKVTCDGDGGESDHLAVVTHEGDGGESDHLECAICI